MIYRYLLALLLPLSLSASAAWDGQLYRLHSKPQYLWAREILLTYPLGGHERVLDVGCGDGKVTAEIAQAVPDGFVLGVDHSPSMIALAEETYDLDLFSNLQFAQCDATQLSYEEQFDLVTSFCCLHWVKEQQAALKGIERALRPGGRFIGCLPMVGPLAEAIEATFRAPRWQDYFVGWSRPVTYYTPEGYIDLLQGAGLQSSGTTAIEFVVLIEDKEEFCRWLTAWLPEQYQLPEELRSLFLTEIYERLVALDSTCCQADRTIRLKHQFIKVDAIKP